jgi:hypothetical protein
LLPASESAPLHECWNVGVCVRVDSNVGILPILRKRPVWEDECGVLPTRRRDEQKTPFGNGEWIHPDIIGVFYPVWRHEVVNLNRVTGGTAVKLYSFELKKELSFTNLRESFFQAVSNSSWAHQGFLAAADISTDEEFREELRRLSSSFGIELSSLILRTPTHPQFLSLLASVMDWIGRL